MQAAVGTCISCGLQVEAAKALEALQHNIPGQTIFCSISVSDCSLDDCSAQLTLTRGAPGRMPICLTVPLPGMDWNEGC